MSDYDLEMDTVFVFGPRGRLPVPRFLLRLLAREIGHDRMRLLWNDEEALQLTLLTLRGQLRQRWLIGEGLDAS